MINDAKVIILDSKYTTDANISYKNFNKRRSLLTTLRKMGYDVKSALNNRDSIFTYINFTKKDRSGFNYRFFSVGFYPDFVPAFGSHNPRKINKKASEGNSRPALATINSTYVYNRKCITPDDPEYICCTQPLLFISKDCKTNITDFLKRKKIKFKILKPIKN